MIVNVIARSIVQRTAIKDDEPAPDGDALITEAEALA